MSISQDCSQNLRWKLLGRYWLSAFIFAAVVSTFVLWILTLVSCSRGCEDEGVVFAFVVTFIALPIAALVSFLSAFVFYFYQKHCSQV